jgi:hypothetical protein
MKKFIGVTIFMMVVFALGTVPPLLAIIRNNAWWLLLWIPTVATIFSMAVFCEDILDYFLKGSE